MNAYLEIEMPKCCRDCRFIGYPGHGTITCAALDGIIAFDDDEVFKPWKHRLKACPLSKIPADHGRLIDADSLRAEFPEPREEKGGWRNPDEAIIHITGVWAVIDCAPTIIPATAK